MVGEAAEPRVSVGGAKDGSVYSDSRPGDSGGNAYLSDKVTEECGADVTDGSVDASKAYGGFPYAMVEPVGNLGELGQSRVVLLRRVL